MKIILFWIPHILAGFLLLQKCECVKIVGGKEVALHSRPYMALLKTNKLICGGTLIKKNWVLTAAHCTVNASTVVRLGVHSQSSPTEEQKLKVSHWIKNCYNEENADNDIQLIQLSEKAKLTKAVRLLPLPKKFSDVKAGTICQVAGWGTTSSKGKISSDKLMEVDVTVIEREDCKAKYRGQITTNMMCTCESKGGKSACDGDSGGPLICKNMYRGIVSFTTSECGIPNAPTVYTFLTKDYITWIKKEIKKKKI